MAQHTRRLHSKRKYPDTTDEPVQLVECPRCPGQMFQGSRGLRYHMLFIHKELTEYKCSEPECEFKAKNGVEMARHRREQHPNRLRFVRRHAKSLRDRECEKCSEIFPSLRELNEHRKVHYTGREGFRWSTPKESRKRFDRPKRKLSAEEAQEERVRWKYCDICDKYESSTLFLRKHLEEVHEKEDDKPLLCYFCHKRFTVQKTLDLHCAAAHTRYTKFAFDCDGEFCEMAFRTWGELHEHLKWHVGQIEQKANDKKKDDNTTETVPDSTDATSSEKCGGDKSPETSDAPDKLKLYYCPDCSFGCLNESLVDVHRVNHIEKIDGAYYCPRCIANFDTQALLIKHYNMVHGGHVLVHQCHICNQRCFSRRALFRHKRRTHNEDELKESSVTCEEPGCNQTFTCVRYLALHVQRAHKSTPQHVCDVCGKLFFWESLLKLHMKCHSDPEFECDICHAKFKKRLIMERHRSRDHRREDDPKGHIRCKEPDCTLRFTSRSLLKRHLQRVHQKGPDLMCQECGALFHHQNDFNRHVIIHEDCKFQCEICNKMFRRSIMLRYHQMRMHNDHRVLEEHICPDCGATYASETGLRFHIDSKHTPDSEKRYPCPNCPKRYHRTALLYQHLKSCKKITKEGEENKEEPVLPPFHRKPKRNTGVNTKLSTAQRKRVGRRGKKAAVNKSVESVAETVEDTGGKLGDNGSSATENSGEPDFSAREPRDVESMQYAQPIPPSYDDSYAGMSFSNGQLSSVPYCQQQAMMYPQYPAQNSTNATMSSHSESQNSHYSIS